MKKISSTRRVKIRAAHNGGMSIADIVRTHHVSRSAVKNIINNVPSAAIPGRKLGTKDPMTTWAALLALKTDDVKLVLCTRTSPTELAKSTGIPRERISLFRSAWSAGKCPKLVKAELAKRGIHPTEPKSEPERPPSARAQISAVRAARADKAATQRREEIQNDLRNWGEEEGWLARAYLDLVPEAQLEEGMTHEFMLNYYRASCKVNKVLTDSGLRVSDVVRRARDLRDTNRAIRVRSMILGGTKISDIGEDEVMSMIKQLHV